MSALLALLHCTSLSPFDRLSKSRSGRVVEVKYSFPVENRTKTVYSVTVHFTDSDNSADRTANDKCIFHSRSIKRSGLKTDINGRGDPLRWPRNTLYPQKLVLTSPTSGGRSVGIVRLRTKSYGVFLFNDCAGAAVCVGSSGNRVIENGRGVTWCTVLEFACRD
jgi:hypothetical protein